MFPVYTPSRTGEGELRCTRGESILKRIFAKFAFFNLIFNAMAQRHLLRLYTMHINDTLAAMTVCFDYGNCLYLYNNGYNPMFRDLSVGTLSKVLSIRDGISTRKNSFDFLKGDEAYKKRLGGTKQNLYRFVVTL